MDEVSGFRRVHGSEFRPETATVKPRMKTLLAAARRSAPFAGCAVSRRAILHRLDFRSPVQPEGCGYELWSQAGNGPRPGHVTVSAALRHRTLRYKLSLRL